MFESISGLFGATTCCHEVCEQWRPAADARVPSLIVFHRRNYLVGSALFDAQQRELHAKRLQGSVVLDPLTDAETLKSFLFDVAQSPLEKGEEPARRAHHPERLGLIQFLDEALESVHFAAICADVL